MDIHDAHTTPGQHHDPPETGELPAPCPHARSYRIQSHTVVEFHGIVDISTVPQIQMHTDAASAREGARMIVDLRPVEFLDCATLGLLEP
ncbi:STAS domain-containing protein [Streptomyces aureocirculatus]|uniref:STAS domain-containing protein n=1 Tax=Streptomyces aureocirculatus TaxID=67275 RepID=UPI00068DC9F7|nr:STAS domain-containing protein [Streptomyces aureocirculatus]